MKLLLEIVCAVCAAPALLAAQSVIPGASARQIATHSNLRMSSDKATLCDAGNHAGCLIFQSNDVPEDKPITVQAILARPFTGAEISLLAQGRSYKSATVTCSDVTVSELTNPQNGRVMKMAVGKGCTLNDLQVRPSAR